MMAGFKAHKHAEARRRSAVHLIKLLLQGDPAILRVHRAEAMSVALWKFTEADGKHNTSYCSQQALAATKAERIHEHVFQRALMINELLENPNDVDRILQQALGCLVTRQEHAFLENYKHLYGWERYSRAGITVVDMRTQKVFALPELTSIKLETKGEAMLKFPKSRASIESNPRFRLGRKSVPGNLQRGQMAIIYECLEEAGSKGVALDDLAEKCLQKRYKTTTDIRLSVLYHLNRIDSAEQM
jgi:hypothetical protein